MSLKIILIFLKKIEIVNILFIPQNLKIKTVTFSI